MHASVEEKRLCKYTNIYVCTALIFYQAHLQLLCWQSSFDSDQVRTRHAGSQSNERNCVDSVFEVDETAKMAGDIANYCSVAANEEDRYDKGGVSIEKTLNRWYSSLKFDQKTAKWE